MPKNGDTETHDLTSSRTPLTNLGEENHSSDAISISNTMAHFNEKHTDDAEATWTRLSRWTQKKIRSIEALLKEAETLQDTAQQHEYTKRITGMILEARTNLLARLWDDTGTLEYDTLWASLDRATILAQRPESDQVGETKGDETVDVNVFCENHGYRSSLG